MTAFVAGLFVMILCLGLQAYSVALAVRYIGTRQSRHQKRRKRIATFRRFSILMLLLMAGNICQAMIWAGLYWILGAFSDFETALYFSGVTFTSLGYGDIVLPPHTRLLAPLQAANGLMMFGITTAVFIATAQLSISKQRDASQTED
jgi:hypothetical protein